MDRYQEFTDTLVSTLEGDSHILGIVALGSMAERGRTPDEWSDHDFFVITEDAEAFRATIVWLPRHEEIALWFRETAHGCKAIYDDGHLIEYAVFTPDEISLARANDYRVLLDRERIEQRMAAIATKRDPSPARPWLTGMFLANLSVAAARARRGETLSARWMLMHAMRHLVLLLGGGPDDLDALRRFHHDGVESAMQQDVLTAARELLGIYEREVGGEKRGIAAVRLMVGEG